MQHRYLSSGYHNMDDFRGGYSTFKFELISSIPDKPSSSGKYGDIFLTMINNNEIYKIFEIQNWDLGLFMSFRFHRVNSILCKVLDQIVFKPSYIKRNIEYGLWLMMQEKTPDFVLHPKALIIINKIRYFILDPLRCGKMKERALESWNPNIFKYASRKSITDMMPKA
ncbi:hypothetical protein M9H77_21753 [Catharanthus roseus]|uniref:Uncharacterized protein n=1 Tax=Catharanthus roseus TaxID=4058 RepID=A0ACC0APZ0_CATRO|nr:hypothetical protein M9H77_21753 [Catharanthus roseus]